MPALKASTRPTPAASRPRAAAITSKPTASQHGTSPPARPRPIRLEVTGVYAGANVSTSCSS